MNRLDPETGRGPDWKGSQAGLEPRPPALRLQFSRVQSTLRGPFPSLLPCRGAWSPKAPSPNDIGQALSAPRSFPQCPGLPGCSESRPRPRELTDWGAVHSQAQKHQPSEAPRSEGHLAVASRKSLPGPRNQESHTCPTLGETCMFAKKRSEYISRLTTEPCLVWLMD